MLHYNKPSIKLLANYDRGKAKLKRNGKRISLVLREGKGGRERGRTSEGERVISGRREDVVGRMVERWDRKGDGEA